VRDAAAYPLPKKERMRASDFARRLKEAEKLQKEEEEAKRAAAWTGGRWGCGLGIMESGDQRLSWAGPGCVWVDVRTLPERIRGSRAETERPWAHLSIEQWKEKQVGE
jgi:hypothetical protein